jgi:hypothetical protein
MRASNMVSFAAVIWIFGNYNLLLKLQISIQNSETLNKIELYILQHCILMCASWTRGTPT